MRPEETAAKDRAVGALLGLAVGDALGTTLEFVARDSVPRVTDLVGGGPFGLAAGRWTDDASMALCLADSLVEGGAERGLDPADLMRRFVRWWKDGENSATGHCFDIGGTTEAALARFERTGAPLAGSADPRSAGNGSLMRLSPVAIRWWNDLPAAQAAARLQSRTTHGAEEAVEACAYFVELLVEAIGGAPADTVLRPREGRKGQVGGRVAEVAAGSFREKTRDGIASSGYVIHTLEAALWAVSRADSFREAVVDAVNLGDDADTVGAVTGQLAGALWGRSGIPEAWLAKLARRERFEERAGRLFDFGTAGGSSRGGESAAGRPDPRGAGRRAAR